MRNRKAASQATTITWVMRSRSRILVHFSVLDKSKLKQNFGFKVPYWTDSLKKCIAELAEAK